MPERATDFLGLKAGVAVAVDEVSDIFVFRFCILEIALSTFKGVSQVQCLGFKNFLSLRLTADLIAGAGFSNIAKAWRIGGRLRKPTCLMALE
ncbi:MAG: hypothetical protein EAZ24_05660 [Burkholderiales bacterium]|nr:MAG: hypothetical protein EAZ24_05660 [Burkholderiales bacterium]